MATSTKPETTTAAERPEQSKDGISTANVTTGVERYDYTLKGYGPNGGDLTIPLNIPTDVRSAIDNKFFEDEQRLFDYAVAHLIMKRGGAIQKAAKQRRDKGEPVDGEVLRQIAERVVVRKQRAAEPKAKGPNAGVVKKAKAVAAAVENKLAEMTPQNMKFLVSLGMLEQSQVDAELARRAGK